MDRNNNTIEKKKIAAEGSISISGVTLMPIVETRTIEYAKRHGVAYIASKTVLALVVLSLGLKKAYRITGEEISLDELVKEYPTIRETIEKL